MSTIIMAACWPLQSMSPAQKAVLISLADQASDDGVCWPAVGTIAKRTCLSERAVQDALAWLQSVGLVFRTYRANTSTSYTISPARFDPSKAPAKSKRTLSRVGADAAPGGADAAPPQMPHPTPADAAPPGADAAPLEVQMPHPNHQLNRNRTVNEPCRTATPPAAKVKTEKTDEKETALQAACKATWAAYSAAYEVRYGTKPVRNQAVNAKVKAFVQRIGFDESPAVAAFYVDRVNESLVLRKVHDVGLLLSGAEGYRTQWVSGTSVAESAAETYAQRAARQRMQEAAPMAARKAPGQANAFDAAQRFMRSDVIDVTPSQQQALQ